MEVGEGVGIDILISVSLFILGRSAWLNPTPKNPDIYIEFRQTCSFLLMLLEF